MNAAEATLAALEDKIILVKPFEERAELLLSRVFGGMHHVFSLKKEKAGERPYWTCVQYGTFATFDFDTLTRLALGAHQYAIRVEIAAGGPGRAKLILHERGKRESEHSWDRHPDINEAIERWSKR